MAYPDIYTIRPMDFILATSVTSEATGQPIEKALDRNLDTFWRAISSADQTVVLDLQNDCQERIASAADREFSGGGNWANNDLATFLIAGGYLSILASASGQYCYLPTAGLEDLQNGERYRLTYDYTESPAGFQFRLDGTDQIIGACVAGTGQTIDFTCTGDSAQLEVVSTSSSGDATLDNISLRRIDSDYAVSGFGAWIRNYNASFGASHELRLEYSDDNSNWTEQADRLIDTEMTNGVGSPLKLYAWSTAEIRRYWRIVSHDVTTIPDVGMFFLFSLFDVAVPNAYPEVNSRSFDNTKRRAKGRRLIVEPGRRIPVQTFERRFRFFNDADRDTFIDAFDACRGGATPIILNEGSDYLVARILTETLRVEVVDYGVSQTAVKFETVPYIADGAVT